MVRKGFTLIELLIVIAVLSILAVAVLSAINPVEQLRKARDAGRKSDAAELLNAYERSLMTFGCWTWENDGTGCVPRSGAFAVAANPDFTAGTADGNSFQLLQAEEMKPQFVTRRTIVDDELYVFKNGSQQVSVCFTPESTSGRTGGLGSIMTDTNSATGTSCAATFTVHEATCNVCVPQ